MSLVMEQRTTRWGEFSAVDLPAIGAGEFKLIISYDSPARLTWTCLVPQHTAPLARGTFVRFWPEEATDPAGVAFSASNPLFEGYIEGIEPQATSIGVSYTACDPTWRATKTVTIFNMAWLPGGDGLPPRPPDNAVPRLIYNCKITNDPDWSVQVGGDGTLGNVIAGILEWCYWPLVECDAGPGDGVTPVLPYDAGDIAAASVKPQEKLDFQSESVRSALEKLNRYDPRLRLLWEPGTRLWRLQDITSAPVVTLPLNTRSATCPVLSLQLKPSTEQCVTAISVYGPETVLTEELRWDQPTDSTATSAGGLMPLGDPVIFETYNTSTGEDQAEFWQAWQIVDPDLRRSARMLADTYNYQKSATLFGQTQYPLLLCSWDAGGSWLEWFAVDFDYLTGSITFRGSPPMFYVDPPPVTNSTQRYFPPNALRLIWAPFGAPLKVRRPETGFEGTAYTSAGIEIERHEYDEALCIGREYGLPVSSAARMAAFADYGQKLLDERKDIVWTGGASQDGLDYRFCRLNKRVAFSVGDGSGGTQSSDWNDIKAYVTEVEYDFEEPLTTLTFSSDKLELFGMDPQQLKARLNIKALQQSIEHRTSLVYGQRALPSGKLSTEVVGVVTTPVFHYTDPEA